MTFVLVKKAFLPGVVNFIPSVCSQKAKNKKVPNIKPLIIEKRSVFINLL